MNSTHSVLKGFRLGSLLIFLCLFAGLQTACQKTHQHEATNAVQLDNGKKWVANPETTTGIKNMQEILSGAAGQDKDLKAGLENEFQLIFKNCTMKGEAHNQLHNYLLPLKDKLKDLGAGSPEKLIEIKEYLDTYFDYFQ
jgi:hypothetical protein